MFMLKYRLYFALVQDCIKSMYVANVDRESIHGKLHTILGCAIDAHVDLQLVILHFLIEVARTSATVSLHTIHECTMYGGYSLL